MKLELERNVRQAPYSLELAELSHLLSTDFPFNKVERRWLSKYEQLGRMVREQGRFPTWCAPRLASWIKNQRARRKIGKVSIERERALNRIQFAWDYRENLWEQQYNNFFAHMKKRDRPLPPGLKDWMSDMRTRWNLLTSRQRRLLRKAGLVRKPIEQKAQRNLEDLEELYKRQGNIEGLAMRLTHFVGRVRRLQKSGKLDADTKTRCDRLGLVWSVKTPAEQQAYWNRRYAEVAEYIKQFGGEIPPPLRWENRELGRWVKSQSGRLRTLPKERQELLGKLRVVSKQELEWEKWYEKAHALYIKLGPYRGRKYKDEDLSLRRWLGRQRVLWDSLSARQQKKLRVIKLGTSNPNSSA